MVFHRRLCTNPNAFWVLCQKQNGRALISRHIFKASPMIRELCTNVDDGIGCRSWKTRGRAKRGPKILAYRALTQTTYPISWLRSSWSFFQGPWIRMVCLLMPPGASRASQLAQNGVEMVSTWGFLVVPEAPGGMLAGGLG